MFFIHVLVIDVVVKVSFPIRIFKAARLGRLCTLSTILVSTSDKHVLFSGGKRRRQTVTDAAGVVAYVLTLRDDVVSSRGRVIAMDSRTTTRPGIHLKVITKRRFCLGSLLCSLVLRSRGSSTIMVTRTITKDMRGFTSLVGRGTQAVNYCSACFVAPGKLSTTSSGKVRRAATRSLTEVVHCYVVGSGGRRRFLAVAHARACRFRSIRKGQSFDYCGRGTFLGVVSNTLSKGAKFASSTKCYCINTLHESRQAFVITLLTYK